MGQELDSRCETRVENIGGYPVTNLGRGEIAERIVSWIVEAKPASVLVCANPHSLHVAESDLEFRSALHHADIVIPDGIGIVIGSKLLGGRINERITGHDVFEDVSDFLNASGGSVFFLGSTKHVLDLISERVSKEYPNVRIAGTYSPPFRAEFSQEESQAMIASINEARPDVLWVGMTAPKQEKWIAQNLATLDVKFVGAIGAVFDFYAGTVPRSPAIFRGIGMEWLPRLVRQPRRLWRRNFVSAPFFFFRILRILAIRRRQL